MQRRALVTGGVDIAVDPQATRVAVVPEDLRVADRLEVRREVQPVAEIPVGDPVEAEVQRDPGPNERQAPDGGRQGQQTLHPLSHVRLLFGPSADGRRFARRTYGTLTSAVKFFAATWNETGFFSLRYGAMFWLSANRLSGS